MLIYLFERLSCRCPPDCLPWAARYIAISTFWSRKTWLSAPYMCWLAWMCLDFRRGGFDISAIRYEDLVERPLEICRRAMDSCGLPVSFADNIVSCMQEDTQNTLVSKSSLSRFRDPKVTPEVKDSLDRLAAKYGLPSVSEGCILEGTISYKINHRA